jgi:hypothetical protein
MVFPNVTRKFDLQLTNLGKVGAFSSAPELGVSVFAVGARRVFLVFMQQLSGDSVSKKVESF